MPGSARFTASAHGDDHGQGKAAGNRPDPGARIADLWSAFDKAWWDDETDPDIRLLTVTPERAELWESPGKLVAFATMLTAAVTGAKPDFGDNATVRM